MRELGIDNVPNMILSVPSWRRVFSLDVIGVIGVCAAIQCRL